MNNAALIAAFFIFDLGRFFDLQYLKSEQAALNSLYENKPLLVILSFFFIYIAVTALSLPGAAILTLARYDRNKIWRQAQDIQ